MAVNTARVADRRQLHFSSFDALQRDVELIATGSPRVTGNYSAGEILAHLADIIRLSIDGFRSPAPPLLLRIGARILKKRILAGPMAPGFKVPRAVREEFMPRQGVSLEEGAAALNRELDRVAHGAQMTRPSPLLGPLTHEQWTQLHLRHAALHLSFIHPAPRVGVPGRGSP